jgi:RimJ/RimL family protein N-acetyltransferase
MKWRNEQIYHLRQARHLTKEDQDAYFENVVASLFDHEHPNQILFSFLENDVCIGYGGLVHINWIDQNAEISFIMDTLLEQKRFQEIWTSYLSLIEKVAFQDIKLHKVYTYSFDLRPQLYKVLLSSNFIEEARLKEHCLFNSKFIDVIIYSKINNRIKLRRAVEDDVNVTFEWATNKVIRNYAIQKDEILYDQHKNWFLNRIIAKHCVYYICELNKKPVGSLRFDINENKEALLSFLLDPDFHGMGYGKEILTNGCNELLKENEISKIIGVVHVENLPSLKTFISLGFSQISQINSYITFEKKYENKRI